MPLHRKKNNNTQTLAVAVISFTSSDIPECLEDERVTNAPRRKGSFRSLFPSFARTKRPVSKSMTHEEIKNLNRKSANRLGVTLEGVPLKNKRRSTLM